ncbi:MAG TPA: hypothetical protein VNR86_08925 [Sphingomicrobium sp.]|nr:hypothetical protein [Sphingomicrobium sp.]
MFKGIILGGAAIATLATPAVADAQYYNVDSGYSSHHHHHRSKAGAAIAAAVIGSVLGYAAGTSRGYGYSNPSYGYSSYGYQPGYNYGYQPTYNYGYSGYGYPNSYMQPSYGYDNGYVYQRDDDDDD